MRYLEKLREINPKEAIAIVMDNLAVHKTKDVQAKMRELQLEWIYVVPYHSDLNAIEFIFSRVKDVFRRKKL